MKRFASLLTMIFTMALAASAQNVVSGVVVDSKDGQPLIGAAVTLTNESGSPVGQISDVDGKFSIKVQNGKYTFKIAFVGYSSYEKSLDITADRKMGTIRLKPENKELDEVKVTGTLVRQEQKGDTTVFNAEAFKVNPDATTEDLIKKMPGIQVDGSTVKSGGEEVKKVLVDGKEFFGSDPMVALKNISADMVSKIEVYDKQSDQSQFTGFSDGNEERTINIMTKMGISSGHFGRVYAGYGTDDRYEMGGNFSVFSGDHRISFIGMLNNINQQNFSFDDVTGAMSMGGGRSMRGAFTAGKSGINRTGSIGVNYSFERENKLKVEFSYFYNNNKNKTGSGSTQEYFQESEEDSVRTYITESSSHSKNNNHRANMRLRWTINSNNTLIFTPSMSWQGYESNSSDSGIDSYGTDLYQTTSQYDTDETSGISAGGDLQWQHKFNRDRRTFSVNVGATVNNSDADDTSNSISEYIENEDNNLITAQITDNESKSTSYNGSIMYTEPLGQYLALQVNYSPSYTKSEGDKSVEADTVATVNDAFTNYRFSPLLSNKKESEYMRHSGGLGLNINVKKAFHATLGLNFQHSELDGDQEYPYAFSTSKSFSSILPSARIRIKSGTKLNFRLNYRTNTSAPSISNLQEVVDVSNIRRYTSGNADLDQQYSHELRFFFVYNNVETSRAIFLMTSLTSTQDYISTSSTIASADSIIGNGITLPSGTQYDYPVNLDGYISARVNLTLSTPLTFIGSNFNLNLGTNLQKKPSIYNGKKVTSKTNVYSAGFSLNSSFSENVDFNVSYNGNYNVVKSTATTTSSNYNYYSHTIGVDLSCLFFSRLVFANNASHQMTDGMGEGYDNNYVSWNAAIGYKFFSDRRAELRLKFNDILDNNRSVSRSIQEAYIQTSTTDVLRRYAMLTFTYKFKPKGTAPTSQDDRVRPPGGMGGGPGGPR